MLEVRVIILLLIIGYLSVFLISGGADFVEASVQFTFLPGTTETICENFDIIDDDIALEGNETFSLVLILLMSMNIQSGFMMELPPECIVREEEIVSNSNVTIIDDDGE